MKTLFLLLFFYTTNVFAEIQATVFLYEEKEQNSPPVNMRYLVTEKHMRVDNGSESDDFILFDSALKKIFSINHDDQTILVIDNNTWKQPDYKFRVNIVRKTLSQAPKVSGQSLIDYSVLVNNEICSRFQLLPEKFSKEMAVFQTYQLVLSGQQVISLRHTPAEMQTPCFLVDQIYNDGAYYSVGLPVQEWHSRGYAKILTNYKQEKVKQDLFSLPEGYKEYSLN
jgi:hypothetical protein